MSNITFDIIEDCSNIIERFASRGEKDFSYFCEEWNRMSFEYIYAAIPRHRYVIQLTEEYFQVTKDILLSNRSFLERIGALYLFYTMYFLQPIEQFCKLRLSLANWKDLKKFEELIKQTPDTIQAQYILNKLYISDAFRFCQSGIIYGLEPFFRRNYYDAADIRNTSVCNIFKNDLNEITHDSAGILAAMECLEDGYNEMKELLNQTGSKNSCGVLSQTEILKDIKPSMLKIDSILMDKNGNLEIDNEETEDEEDIREKRVGIRKKAFKAGSREKETALDVSFVGDIINILQKDCRKRRNNQSCKKVLSQSLPLNILRELEIKKPRKITKGDHRKSLAPIDDDIQSDDNISADHEFTTNKIRYFPEAKFKRSFRMKRETCQQLIKEYENSDVFKNRESGCSSQIDAELEFFMFLWFAGNNVTTTQVAECFGFQENTILNIIQSICEFLCSISKKVISFPKTDEDKKRTISEFKKITCMPRILGFVYYTYFKLSEKVKITQEYLKLNAIFDARKTFLEIFFNPTTDDTDSTDSLEFLSTDILHDNVTTDNISLFLNKHNVVKNYIIKPFKTDVRLGVKEKYFNRIYSAARFLFKDVFDILRTRFPQINRTDFISLDATRQFILACCVLYNFCIKNDDCFDEFMNTAAEPHLNIDEFVDGCSEKNHTRSEIVYKIIEDDFVKEE